MNALTLLHQNVSKSNTDTVESNILEEPDIKYENSLKKKKPVSTLDNDLHTLIQSNKNLTEAKLIDSEAGLLLAQTNARLTARVLQNLDNGVKNEPEILEALNANMRGLLAAIAKVATGARFETEEIAVAELGKIVHEKHRKAIPADT